MKIPAGISVALACMAMLAPACAQTSAAQDARTQAGSSVNTLPTVTVTDAQNATRPGALADDIVKTESIGAAEIKNSAPELER